MKDSAKTTRSPFPSELRWRIAILAALALTVPILRHGGRPGQPPGSVAHPAAQSATTAGGWGMAGFLPGVAPITLGHTLHAPGASHS